MNWDDFEIMKTVVHYVPTTKDTPSPAILLTEEAIDLDSDLTDYFADKVTDRLKVKGLEVVEDAEADQTAPDALAAILATPDTLV